MRPSLRKLWMTISIKRKIGIFAAMVILIMALSATFSICIMNFSLGGFNTILNDNSRCHDFQEALDLEIESFADYIRDATPDTRDQYVLSCVRTERCLRSLPFDYARIGTERYARTWSILNGYETYQAYRDELAETQVRESDFVERLYRVYKMQEYLQTYARRLVQVTLKEGNDSYQEKVPVFYNMPYLILAISAVFMGFVMFLTKILSNALVSPAVGDPDMVRSPLFRYGNQNYETMDMTPGPWGDNYPQDCWVDDCLITMTGRDEKQTAPVQISMSQRIRVSHCSIYDVPRAGININEGTFGGHVIEFCDVFNTVLETGDHGSFNSWGRDRFWTPDVVTISDQVALHPDMQYWDVLEPNVLRYNRWRCDHGWDVDLDDGSSFYRIYCNLLLNGGLKMREGYDRVATNNIILNNSLHPHVWVRNSDDVFKHNIVFTAYQPAVMNSALGESDRWGKELDYNLFATGQAAMRKFAAHGADAHSVSADPLFVNPGQGDFRVRPESPAFKIGFRNFDMTDFGVKSEKLKKLARTPDIPEIVLQIQDEVSAEYTWLGAVLKEVKGEELSAYGAKFSQASMALDRVPAESEAYKLGLRSGDLLLSFGGKEISTAASFKQLLEEYARKSGELLVMRNQKEMVVKLAAFRGEMQPVER